MRSAAEAYLKGFFGTLGVFTACAVVIKFAGSFSVSYPGKTKVEDDTTETA